MNKPTYAAIMQHSPTKPVLVFVSSRRQTRLTALELISYANSDENPKQFLNMDGRELERVINAFNDSSLQHCVAFGIGIRQKPSFFSFRFHFRFFQTFYFPSSFSFPINPLLHLCNTSSSPSPLSNFLGLHHAGLKSDDRALVEQLFKESKIQILVSTSTLAWGVNLPAHLVVVREIFFFSPVFFSMNLLFFFFEPHK